MYTQEEIDEFKAKADKWDALDDKIGEVFSEDNDEDFDLSYVGELAAQAFGYL